MKRDSDLSDLVQGLRERIIPDAGGLGGLDEILNPGSGGKPQGKGIGRILTLAAGAFTVWEMMRGQQQEAPEPDQDAAPRSHSTPTRSRSEEMRQRVRDLRKR